MRFTITSQGTDIPLELDILGYHIEISDIDNGSISLSDADGQISVCYVKSHDPIAEPALADDTVIDDTLQSEIIETDSLNEIEADTAQSVEPIVDPVMDKDKPITDDPAEQLFLILSALRKQIALDAKLPTYIIFHDNTLRDMCKLLPSNIDELSLIHGVGKAKLEKYGLIFIQAIQEYIAHLKEVA